MVTVNGSECVACGACVDVCPEGAISCEDIAVIDASKLESREVTLGKNDGDSIEVTSGLKEGDIVLILNQSSSMMDMVMGM